MRVFKYLMLGFFVFCVFNISNVKAGSVAGAIKGNSVFRTNSTSASVSFISNSNGTIYYTVNENSSAEVDELMENAGDIISYETTTIDIPSDLLSSGSKYVHIVVKNNLNNYSNILTIPMPKDIYYFDDFEAYNVDSYPEYFGIRHNGGDETKQIITEISENNVFSGYGTFGKGLDERVQIEPVSTGYIVLEADIFATNIPDENYFGGIIIGDDYNNDDRNINVVVDHREKKFAGANYFTGYIYKNKHTSSIDFEENTNYRVKIVVDVINDSFNYYINGVKANSEPIVAPELFDQLVYFGIYNGSGTVYYDNFKFYSQSTNPCLHSIIKGLETNGTFLIDKTSAEKDETITITPTPDAGYRVKSIKVNNSEAGITHENSNYTFTMLDENVEVTVEFEEIVYDVTNGGGQEHIVGTEENAVFVIDADKDLFSSVYLNNEELLPVFYTITEGSTIITLKQEFINNLLPGTYNLRATFSDGGEANTTFVVATLPEDNPVTGDSIMTSLILGSISFVGLLLVGFYVKKQQYN